MRKAEQKRICDGDPTLDNVIDVLIDMRLEFERDLDDMDEGRPVRDDDYYMDLKYDR